MLERRFVRIALTAAASSRSSVVSPKAVESTSPFALCSEAVTARNGAEKRSMIVLTSQHPMKVPARTQASAKPANAAIDKTPAASRASKRPSAPTTEPASSRTVAMKRRFSGELRYVASILA